MAADDRLGRLETRMERVEARVIQTNGEVHEARQDIHDILVTIQGPPRDESIRGRLHLIENNNAAAKAAEAALAAVQAVRNDRDERNFSRAEKKLGLMIAAGLLASNWIAPFLFHHHF